MKVVIGYDGTPVVEREQYAMGAMAAGAMASGVMAAGRSDGRERDGRGRVRQRECLEAPVANIVCGVAP